MRRLGRIPLSFFRDNVDDTIITGNDFFEMRCLKKVLTKEFKIKDLGNLRYFLGMGVARSRDGISVSQRNYIVDLLNEIGMMGCKPADTPMEFTTKLDID